LKNLAPRIVDRSARIRPDPERLVVAAPTELGIRIPADFARALANSENVWAGDLDLELNLSLVFARLGTV